VPNEVNVEPGKLDPVKLDPQFHVPEENPDIHLQRLLAPQDLDEPFYKSIAKTFKNIIHPPPPLPPLVLTSKPVDPSELKGLNGLYAGGETRAGIGSLLVHLGIIGLLLFLGSLKPVQKAVKEMTTLILPVEPPKLENKGGGGGGARQPMVKKAELPKPARQFVAPTEPVQTKLPAPISVNADLPDINPTDVGNLTGLTAMAGAGAGAGFGNGRGGGIGNGNGNGVGDGSGGGRGGGVYRPGNGVTNPRVIYQQEPQYSEEARKAKWQGSVLLSLVVDENGRPTQVKVVRPLGLGLDEKAIEAIMKWKFEPGRKDGKPVAVAAQVEVTFRLL
jgi:protein TonB